MQKRLEQVQEIYPVAEMGENAYGENVIQINDSILIVKIKQGWQLYVKNLSEVTNFEKILAVLKVLKKCEKRKSIHKKNFTCYR